MLKAHRFRLDIDHPGKISITISERYTEDIIFTQFAKCFQSEYDLLLQQSHFKESVEAFQKALTRNGKSYIVNMARSDEYDAKGDYETMVQRNIIVPFENYKNLDGLKDVLYQIRCNVFHGEKVPGVINDDSLVKSAYPVLLAIMEFAVLNHWST